MGFQTDTDTYDCLHATVEQDNGARSRAIYAPLFRALLRIVETLGAKSVLEVGCGSGLFAELLVRRLGLAYRGFDFSPTGVAHARARVPDGTVFVGDALSAESYGGSYDCIVCSEVLEHIPADLEAMALWPRGSYCVCSVPNFDYPTHVRFFRTEREVRERYGKTLDITVLLKIPAPARAGRPLPEYLHRLLWARADPKRLLGLLGINSFDWNAGWFVFAGVRR